MNSTKTWFAELLYALKTLPRNPYLLHRWQKITRPRALLAVVSAYVVFTIAHVAVNCVIVSSPLDLDAWLILDLALQMTYLQQLSLLFLVTMIFIPLITVIGVIHEKTKNRLAFVQLTPLSHHQIIIGILSREFIFMLLGIFLHIPLTIVSLLMNNVDLIYALVMILIQLPLAGLFSSSIGFLTGLFFYKETVIIRAVNVVFIISFCIFTFNHIIWQENEHKYIKINPFYAMSANHITWQENEHKYIKINPFYVMSAQGLQFLPIRFQIPHNAIKKFSLYLKKEFSSYNPPVMFYSDL